METLIDSYFSKERKKASKISRVSKNAGLCSFLFGLTAMFINPALGAVLSVGGLGLSTGQYMLDVYKNNKYGVFSALGNKIVHTYSQ